MLFIYDVHKERDSDDQKIWGNFADGCVLCFGKGDFSDTLDFRRSKKQISPCLSQVLVRVFSAFNCYKLL